MTEIIIAGTQMHDVNGRPISGPENFDEASYNAMYDIQANPRGEDRQTIPIIMSRDTSLCSKPLRYWLNRPNRMHPDRRVWRFFFDIGRVKTGGGLLEMRRCEVTGRRKGEFGGDPDLDNDGWGSDGGSDGDDDGDGDDAGGGGGDDDEYGARHMGGEDQDDGDSANGGWGRGFGGASRRAHRRGHAEDEDAGKDETTAAAAAARASSSSGRSCVTRWASQAS